MKPNIQITFLNFVPIDSSLAFFFAGNDKNGKRILPEISRIEVFPKNAAVWEGEQVVLSAYNYPTGKIHI